MVYTRNNSFFICHRCLHVTFLKSDIKRHINKQYKCEAKYCCLLSPDEVATRSIHKRYFFLNVTHLPTFSDYQLVKLITNYHKALNVITDINDLYGNKVHSESSCTKTDDVSNQTMVIVSDSPSLTTHESLESNSTSCQYKDEYFQPIPTSSNDLLTHLYNDSSKSSESIDVSKESDHTVKSTDIQTLESIPKEALIKLFEQFNIRDITEDDRSSIVSMDADLNKGESIVQDNLQELYKHFVDKYGNKLFQCTRCMHTCNRKDNIIRHITSSKKCTIHSMVYGKAKGNLVGNTVNISNNQYIVNNNNTQNNTIQNVTKLELKDFGDEDYDYLHIPKNIVDKSDFYLHKNFFREILLNDVNKNIYFDKKYAFVYMNGRITRIPRDKGVCLAIMKMRKTINSYMSYNNKIKHNTQKIDKIDKFHSVMVNKYLVDTIHRTYNPETFEFERSNSLGIRVRDRVMSDITYATEEFNDITKKILEELVGCDQSIDECYQVNIEHYVPSRLRTQQLKDDY